MLLQEETKELQEEALQIFNQCYSQFSEIFAENHLEAIKCITMIGLVCRRLERITDALEWCRKEVKVREEVRAFCSFVATNEICSRCKGSFILELNKRFECTQSWSAGVDGAMHV